MVGPGHTDNEAAKLFSTIKCLGYQHGLHQPSSNLLRFFHGPRPSLLALLSALFRLLCLRELFSQDLFHALLLLDEEGPHNPRAHTAPWSRPKEWLRWVYGLSKVRHMFANSLYPKGCCRRAAIATCFLAFKIEVRCE